MRLLMLPSIRVKDKRGENLYTRVYDKNGIPNYYPSTDIEPYGAVKDSLTAECFFLPIDGKVFKKDRKNKFYGYRYVYTTGMNTVSVKIASDELEYDSIMSIQLSVEVFRFLYHIEKENIIVIDRYCSALHPAMFYNINTYPKQAALALQNSLEEIIPELNSFYINRKI